MGTPEFPDLGKHCSVRECSLVDFLPFTCDACKQVFCLEHRTYGMHKCPKANARDATVLVCPICAKGVRLVAEEDPNITWDRHVQTNCDPSNYTKATKKPRCIVPGCKELLTFSNKVRCKDCGREICLKHRFGADHNCQELRKADAAKNGSFFGSKFFQSFSTKAAGAPTGVASKGAAGASSMRASNSSARELCIQCGERFSTVEKLIQHAERIHRTGQWRVANSQEQLDVCPKCGKGFKDAIALVNHVEQDHGGTSVANSQEHLDVCPKCGRGFKDAITLVSHVEQDHGGTSRSYPEKCAIS